MPESYLLSFRSKLIERGVPEHEIAFIHNADTETKKKELFAKVRQGKVRILLGSTFKMGAGTNIQDLLIATHDVDCPWRPADLEQRAGRIVRQGNKNDEVTIFRYATNGTFDSYLWQTVEAKQKFISQIMSSKSPVRSCEDVDETALSYAEIKALCAGNPLIAEKMNLDIEVAKLRMLKAEHQSQHYRLEDSLLKHYPLQIASLKGCIAGIESDIEAFKIQNEKTPAIIQSPDGSIASAAHFPGMTINGIEYTEKEPAAKALLEACKGITSDKNDKPIGLYMGFQMSLHYEGFGKTFSVHLRGKMTYQAELGTDTFGNITRINHALINLPKRLEGVKTQLDTLYENQQAAKLELEKPFSLADELAEKEARLAFLDAELNIDKMESRSNDSTVNIVNDTNNILEDEPDFDYDFDSVSAKNTRPSFLNEIRAFDTGKSRSASGKKTTEPEL